MKVGGAFGNLWVQFRGFFSYEEWTAIGLSLSISLPLCSVIVICIMRYERKYDMTIGVAIRQFVKRLFKRKNRAKTGNGF